MKRIFFLILLSFFACKNDTETSIVKDVKAPTIVNFDDKLAFGDFKKLNLDDKCANLLDPRNTAEDERTSVINSWSSFHKKVTVFLEQENFKWEIPDSTISIYNRIYFNKNGTINYYVFNINNPSVTAEKKAEFEKVLEKFSRDVKLDLKREQEFAQCGKTRYINY